MNAVHDPAITAAVSEMIPLLRTMHTDNLDTTLDKIDEIRHRLSSEQAELEVVAMLISIGEI